MENAVPTSLAARTENQTIGQSITSRRASLSLLSRSAPDAFTLAQLAPLRSASRSSLPETPLCSVATQTPTDASLRFEFPDPFDFGFLDLDTLDATYLLNGTRRESRASIGSTSTTSEQDDSVEPEEISFLNRCLRRLSFTDTARRGGLNRRVSFTEQRSELKIEVQGVGQTLRSIGDDFERSRLTRTQSLSFVSQKKR